MSKDYFPQGIAKDKAFLGRKAEINRLTYNVQHGHHTLLLAPRRFGKTSLARYVLAHLKIPSAEVNFYLVQNAKSVEAKILAVIKKMISELADHRLEQLLKKMSDYFASVKKTWTFGIRGLAEIELTPQSHEDIPENILTALNFLDRLLCEKKQKAVLFFDEIQEIHHLSEGRALQGSIREFAQQSKAISFIFSGSNRRLLSYLFDDQSMPLYELCERIKLEKIDSQAYKKYINYVAHETKGKQLDDAILEAILTVTDRHPKRVYNLCYLLWQLYPELNLTLKKVSSCWHRFVDERLDSVRVKLKKLSSGQFKVLALLALSDIKQITGKMAQRALDLTSSSISQALVQLEQENYIDKNEEGAYTIIDPLIKSVIQEYEYFSIDQEAFNDNT